AVKREPGGFDTVVAGKEAFYLIDRHDYVVLSQRREFVTRLAKTQAGLNTILSKEQTRKFLDADLSVYVDVGTVNKELDKGIAAAIPGISQYIQLRSEVEGFPAAAAKRVSAEVCRAIDDTDRCLLTMEAKPKGLGIHAFFKLRRGTNTDRLLRAFKPSPHDPLARLPTGQTNYFGVQ